MTLRCPTALLSLLIAPAPLVLAQNLPNVDACISRLDAQVDIGYDRIAARCPDLVRQLEQGPLSAWLPRGWKEPSNDLSAGSLKELRELARIEMAAPAPKRSLDSRTLNMALARLGDAGDADGTRWTRFKTWLRSVLESREQAPADSWFTRLVSHVGFTQSVIVVISYVALALTVVLAGLIVLNELRTAGMPARLRLSRRERRAAREPDGEGVWGEIERTALLERPRLLLKLITLRLCALGFLPPAGGMTVRELTRSAALRTAEDRATLAELARIAEEVRYSSREVPEAVLEAPIAGARELLGRLDESLPA
jgi:hypothetical protein